MINWKEMDILMKNKPKRFGESTLCFFVAYTYVIRIVGVGMTMGFGSSRELM
jgi:hypothetical protein